MSDVELKRRKVHGVLSSKSLLESLERLTLNKTSEIQQASKSSLVPKKIESENAITYAINVRNNQNLNVQSSLSIKSEGNFGIL